MRRPHLRILAPRVASVLDDTLAGFTLVALMLSILPALPAQTATVDPLIEISGHRSEVRFLRYLGPDGHTIISSSFDSLVIWDAENGREMRRLIDGAVVFPFAVSPDGSRVLTVDRTGARILDTDSGEIVIRFDPAAAEQLLWAAWSPGAEWIAAHADAAIHLWNPSSAELVRRLETGFRHVPRLAWSPDGSRIAALGADGTLVVFELSGGSRVFEVEAHSTTGVHQLAWAPSGDFIATGGADGVVRIWNAQAWGLAHTLQQVSNGGTALQPPDPGLRQGLPISALAFSPDSRLVASADDSVRIWDLETGEETVRWFPNPEDDSYVPHFGTITALEFAPAGSLLASAGLDASVKVWDARDETQVASIDTFLGAVETMDWSPDGTCVAMAGADGASVVWNVMAGREEARFEGHGRGTVLALDFAPSVPRMVTSGQDGAVKVWYTGNGGLLFDLLPLDIGDWPRISIARPAQQVWYSPKSNRVLTLSGVQSGSILEARTVSTKVGPLTRLGSQVSAAAWSPDARRVAVAGYGFYIVDFEDLDSAPIVIGQDGPAGPGEIEHVAWTHDGERVLTASEGGAAIWDWRTGRRVLAVHPEAGASYVEEAADESLLLTIDGQFRAPRAQAWSLQSEVEVAAYDVPGARVESVRFLDDGKRVITTYSRAPVARVWDASTGQELFVLAGHRARLVGVSVSPDGKLIATASRDGTVRLWGATTGRFLAVLGSRLGALTGVRFSPDGRRVAAYGVGGAALWELSTAL